MNTVEVQGTCSERFEPVRAALADRLSSGDELGACIVVDVDGQAVADLWGGSLIVMDLGRRMTVSYMMNKMGAGVVGSDRGEAYLRAIYSS